MFHSRHVGYADLSFAEPGKYVREFHFIRGTIQRVNYGTGELRLIAEGRPWLFSLSPECRLLLNGQTVPFRCFQPLDHVNVFYERDESGLVAEALYLWAEEPTNSPSQRRWASDEMDVA